MNVLSGGPGAVLFRRLKSRQLLLLIGLDEFRSLRKAASAVNMTQPTATKMLQELEATVGERLFERGRRGVTPTVFGDAMIRHARFTVTDLERTQRELAALSSGATGTVRIGAVISAVPFLLATAVARLKRDQPGLIVSLDVGTSDALVPALASGELDVLLARPLVLQDRPEFRYVDLVDEPLFIVGRVGHPLTNKRNLTLASLAGWPWTLLPSKSPMRKVLAPIFAQVGSREPVDLVETSSMLTMMALLQESDTLAVLPADVAAFATQWGMAATIAVELPPVMGSYGVVTRHDLPLSPGIRAFLEILLKVVAEGAGSRSAPGRVQGPVN